MNLLTPEKPPLEGPTKTLLVSLPTKVLKISVTFALKALMLAQMMETELVLVLQEQEPQAVDHHILSLLTFLNTYSL